MQSFAQIKQVQSLQSDGVSALELVRQAQRERVSKLAPPAVGCGGDDDDATDLHDNLELAALAAPQSGSGSESDITPESSPTSSPGAPVVICTSEMFVGSAGFRAVPDDAAAAPPDVVHTRTDSDTDDWEEEEDDDAFEPEPETLGDERIRLPVHLCDPATGEPVGLCVPPPPPKGLDFAQLVHASELVEDPAAGFHADGDGYAVIEFAALSLNHQHEDRD
jgi:hypothetical protein